MLCRRGKVQAKVTRESPQIGNTLRISAETLQFPRDSDSSKPDWSTAPVVSPVISIDQHRPNLIDSKASGAAAQCDVPARCAGAPHQRNESLDLVGCSNDEGLRPAQKDLPGIAAKHAIEGELALRSPA